MKAIKRVPFTSYYETIVAGIWVIVENVQGKWYATSESGFVSAEANTLDELKIELKQIEIQLTSNCNF